MTLKIDHASARELWRMDRDHFLHPWTHFDSFKESGSLIMTSSQGSYVYDAEGKRYLDGIGGLWCVNIGHGRKEMVDAIARQAQEMAFFNPFVDTTNIPAARLAAKLAELAPGPLNHVFFTCGGSTANDTAFRLIQFYNHCRGQTERKHIIARREAYHGSTYAAMSIGAKAIDRIPEFDFITDRIHHLSAPNMYRRPDGMSEAAYCDHLVAEFEAKITEIGGDKVAAFFAEPIMGAGGVLMPPEDYLRRMWEVCRKHDILFVADEVVTGFGRLGHFFASKELFGVQPDILVTAKGLTSGYQPLGAMIYSDAIHDVISAPNPDRWFTNGFTYSGHPVACAAALKNIEIMETDDIFANVRELGPYFFERLSELKDVPTVGDVRGSHFMLCIENVADKASKRLFADKVNIGKRISNECEQRGLIIRPVGHYNILSPPLIYTREQCDKTVDILRQSMEKVDADLAREGLLT